MISVGNLALNVVFCGSFRATNFGAPRELSNIQA